jgi:hypothetical protein
LTILKSPQILIGANSGIWSNNRSWIRFKICNRSDTTTGISICVPKKESSGPDESCSSHASWKASCRRLKHESPSKAYPRTVNKPSLNRVVIASKAMIVLSLPFPLMAAAAWTRQRVNLGSTARRTQTMKNRPIRNAPSWNLGRCMDWEQIG